MSPSIRYKAFASTRPFGVEMEVNEKVDRDTMGNVIQKVDPNREVMVTGWTMTGIVHGVPSQCWSVKTDSTCATVLAPGNYGHEVASFKASGNADIKTIGAVADGLRKAHCEVNHRCGIHVHAEVADWDRKQVGVMLGRWCKIESIVAQALPPHRRSNHYAKLMRKKHKIDYDLAWSGEDLYGVMEPTNLEVHHNREKRVAINLIGYATGLGQNDYGRKTAELRLPEGTLDREDVENWARLYVHFIEECHGRIMVDLKEVGLLGALEILGLAGENEFYLLSPELHETKVWFLKRILKYTNNMALFHEVINLLNRLVDPVEKFAEIHPVENAA